MSLRTTWGRRSCAPAAKLTSNKQKDKNNLFISLIYNVRAKVRQNGETAKRRPENTRLFSVPRAPGEGLCPPSAVPLGCSLPCVKSVTCSVSVFSVAKIFPRRGVIPPWAWKFSSKGVEFFRESIKKRVEASFSAARHNNCVPRALWDNIGLRSHAKLCFCAEDSRGQCSAESTCRGVALIGRYSPPSRTFLSALGIPRSSPTDCRLRIRTLQKQTFIP